MTLLQKWGEAIPHLVAAVVVIALGFAVAHDFGPLLLVAVCVGIAPVALAASPYVVALGLALPLYIPVDAMLVQAVGPLPIGPLMALYVLFVASVTAVGRPSSGLPDPLSVAAVLVLVLGGVIGSAVSGFEWLPGLTLLCLWLGALLLGAVLVNEGKAIKVLLWLAAPAAVLALLESLGLVNPWPGLLGPFWVQVVGERSSATFGHPLVAGSALMIVALLGLSHRLKAGKGIDGFIPLMIAASVVTLSRTAIVAALAFVSVGVLRVTEGRHRLLVNVSVLASVLAIAILTLPGLETTIKERYSGLTTQQQAVRQGGVEAVLHDVTTKPWTLLLGDGLRSSQNRLAETGGNAGYDTYDNTYVTLTYDAGLIALLTAIVCLTMAVARSSRRGAFDPIPIIVACGVMFAFFDALYWMPTAALFFFIVGMSTGRTIAADATFPSIAMKRQTAGTGRLAEEARR